MDYPISHLVQSHDPKPDVSTVRLACENGEIEARKVGKTWLIKLPDYLRWLKDFPRKRGVK